MVLGGKCKNAADQVLSQKFMWLGCFVWSTRQVLEEQEVLSLDQWNCSGYESCHPFLLIFVVVFALFKFQCYIVRLLTKLGLSDSSCLFSGADTAQRGQISFFVLVLHQLIFFVLLSLSSGDMKRFRGNGKALGMNSVNNFNKTAGRFEVLFYPGQHFWGFLCILFCAV